MSRPVVALALVLVAAFAACDGAEPPERITLPEGTPEQEIYAHCLEEARALAEWEQPNLASRSEFNVPGRDAAHYEACLKRHGLI